MRNLTTQQDIYSSIEDCEARHYAFTPSISRHKAMNGKSYFVRSYFKDGTDFSVSMERLARKQNNKIVR